MVEIVYRLVIFVDALWVSIRRNGSVAKEPVYIISGIKSDGRRDILDFSVEVSESALRWEIILEEFKRRGVEEVLLFVADGLSSLPDHIYRVFPQAKFQSCIVHKLRNTMLYVKKKDRESVLRDLKTLYKAQSKEEAYKSLNTFAGKWFKIYPALESLWTDEHCYSFYDFPQPVRRYIYTTNSLESINKILRKGLKCRNSFPTPESVEKLIFLRIKLLPTGSR